MDKEIPPTWMRIQTLGEGAYGEVILLKHRNQEETVAAKIIDIQKHKDAKESAIKEWRIHSCLNHPNIIKLYGRRKSTPDHPLEYLFLEYAVGGELFNRIEPDFGMPFCNAQKYMRQLLAGLEYIHKKGIAHRDIKPENLLLDGSDNLKISDFGLATVFRLRGKERMLSRRCGTLPYVAPEVFTPPYYAQPADVWSCGLVLLVLVTGALPWNEPTFKCENFRDWATDQYLLSEPWSILDNTILSLIRKLLAIDVKTRLNIEQIRRHPWMSMKFVSPDIDDDTSDIARKLQSRCEGNKVYEPATVTLSQPVQVISSALPPQNISELLKAKENKFFSQPTQNEDLYICSEMPFSQSAPSQNDFQYLIQRMTRFFVKTSIDKTIELLSALLDNMHYTWNTDVSGVFTISTVDSRKMQLVFKATLIDMDGKLLLDFRLSKGCGLEFKRRFIKIKKCLAHIALKSSFDKTFRQIEI